jgi:hypothetical protein
MTFICKSDSCGQMKRTNMSRYALVVFEVSAKKNGPAVLFFIERHLPAIHFWAVSDQLSIAVRIIRAL